MKSGVCNPAVSVSYRKQFKCPHCYNCYSSIKGLNIHIHHNSCKYEENTIHIDMEIKQFFNIEGMIEKVAIDTIEEGEIKDAENINSYIAQVDCIDNKT